VKQEQWRKSETSPSSGDCFARAEPFLDLLARLRDALSEKKLDLGPRRSVGENEWKNWLKVQWPARFGRDQHAGGKGEK
jgi:hypothetical protein